MQDFLERFINSDQLTLIYTYNFYYGCFLVTN